MFLYRYGDHRDLHVLTHSFPTRRSSDLPEVIERGGVLPRVIWSYDHQVPDVGLSRPGAHARARGLCRPEGQVALADRRGRHRILPFRSEEHTSELQSLMRISYAVFFLTKKIKNQLQNHTISVLCQ